jgi:hypothetical protein
VYDASSPLAFLFSERCIVYCATWHFIFCRIFWRPLSDGKFCLKLFTSKNIFFNLFFENKKPQKHLRNLNKVIFNPKTSSNEFKYSKSNRIKTKFIWPNLFFSSLFKGKTTSIKFLSLKRTNSLQFHHCFGSKHGRSNTFSLTSLFLK